MIQVWGADFVVARGVCYPVVDLEGFIAWNGERRAGILTYLVEGDTCAVVTIDCLVQNAGAGTKAAPHSVAPDQPRL